jgi:hypothetical protein
MVVEIEAMIVKKKRKMDILMDKELVVNLNECIGKVDSILTPNI